MPGYPEDLFQGTAPYYSRYRTGYPAELLDQIRDHYRPDGRGRLLDLGCGTGQLLVPLHPDFGAVVAIDSEPEMIAEARLVCARLGITGVDFRVMPAEAMDAGLGEFELIVCGNAFHWMDRARVLELCYERLRPGGGLVILAGGGGSIWNGNQAWQQDVVRVIQRWLGEERRAGSGTFPRTPKLHQDYIRESRFQLEKEADYTYLYTWDLERITGFLYSTSFCNRSLLGDNADAFTADLHTTLLARHPRGEFSEEIEITYFFMRK